ncbi:MAG: helix-turn-helix transcriptional regulator [Microbacterium sp.]|nr:helix-turn-helix transcriptional regulator [Microbacterium sp.]MCV0374382.1 helix-turn-helix transcriptional regulator [Microbacterium sp.]MCV0389454.1 helix-turn-helix transcriptional regulator [Microbacterium sp.]MCV0418988.1 helix-turn-helix transcriptional regulator [Microbacterium sp.]MCV0421294.1 helix-turn-helix transcriptional regulator [Microbacterium sp.]
MSAERLSTRVPMSRAVIANIESGRKRDITIDEMLALAWALDVPPVALALPLEQPNVFVETSRGTQTSTHARAHNVIDWFTSGKRPGSAGPTPPQTIATTRLTMLRDYYQTLGRIVQAEARLARNDTTAQWEAILTEEIARRDELAEGLTGLGVDLTDFKIDETGLVEDQPVKRRTRTRRRPSGKVSPDGDD